MTASSPTIAELSAARKVVAAFIRPLVSDEKTYEALFSSASTLGRPEWRLEAWTWLADAKRPEAIPEPRL